METPPPKKLVILGAGGHGRVIAESARLMGIYGPIEFLDARYPDIKSVSRYKVVGTDEIISESINKGTSFVVGIGDNLVRKRIFCRLDKMGVSIATVVHPSALVSPDVILGRGTVVFAGAIVNVGANIGENVILNTGSIVEHDVTIQSHSHIAPGGAIAGGAYMGESSLLGLNASVLPGIQVGEACVLGAGCVVTTDISNHNTVAGVPAKVISKKSKREYK